MLRITRVEGGDGGRETTLKLEGRLVGPWVEELRAEARRALLESDVAVLDLAAVGHADADGIAALRELEAQGAALAGAGAYIAELLHGAGPQPARSASALPMDARDMARLRPLQMGDDAAWEHLVRANVPRLLATARRLMREETAARAVVLAAFATADATIHDVDGSCSLATWLHRIVMREALRRLDPSIDAAPAVEAAVVPAETTARRALRALPADDLAVFLLRDVEGHPLDEVGRVLSIHPAAVPVRLHRARQRLKAAFAAHGSAAAVG